MFRHWRADIRAVMERDPAARSTLEVALCYPGFRAVRRHRRAHWLWNHGMKLLARIVSQRTRRRTGIEIHPGATLGEGLFIDHGMGVVIGETAEVGDNVTLYQHVTLGGTGKDVGKRHPTIGNGVVIGAGAMVLGPFRVGDGAKIGAGAVVLKQVPAGATVVGNPGRVVRMFDQKVDALDQVHLPDPVKERIEELTRRTDRLEQCIARSAAGLPCDDCAEKGLEYCALADRKERQYADL
ncbi:MAG: serine O-acetyltransferase [Clostridiales bacterium]|nr:serine O-acetyltransferase [Clostridiales bacterium]